jgi:hypothetical protein
MSETPISNSSECALDVDKPFCSDIMTVKEVAKFVRQKSGTVPDSSFIVIKRAKEITKCATEECALKTIAKNNSSSATIIKKTLTENIKLDGPSDSQQLLHNDNIDSVIHQLVGKHNGLKHVKFHMINFHQHDTEMKRINLLTDVIDKGYNSLCVVLNTDKYGGGGIHWFCVFCDFRSTGSSTNPFTVEHFNSSGRKATSTVADWMIRAKYDIEKNEKYRVKLINAAPIRHQIDTETECGVYCLYFIHKRINNIGVEFFAKRVKDSNMIEFRKSLFRNRQTDPAL